MFVMIFRLPRWGIEFFQVKRFTINKIGEILGEIEIITQPGKGGL